LGLGTEHTADRIRVWNGSGTAFLAECATGGLLCIACRTSLTNCGFLSVRVGSGGTLDARTTQNIRNNKEFNKKAISLPVGLSGSRLECACTAVCADLLLAIRVHERALTKTKK
jgi:hypothetical protein